MKKKIIVLSHRMSKQKWERLEFKYLKNCEVEIHDCSNFLLKNKNLNKEIELINCKKVVFKNLNSWKIYINKFITNFKKNIIVIDTIGNFENFGNSLNLFLIYYHLKMKNLFLIKFHYPGIPLSHFFIKKREYCFKKIFKVLYMLFLNPLITLNKLNFYFFLFLGKILKFYPNIVFVAGKQFINRIKKQNKKTIIVPFSTIDYSKILIKKRNKIKSIKYSNNYAVYISDRDYIMPPEEALQNKVIKSNLSFYGWHKPLLNFFDNLEKKFNLKIIIAAHPKGIKKNNIKMFSPRRVFFNKTYKLIKHCKFVITLRSSAMNYAVIYKKPIIFLTGKELTDSQNTSISSIANHFNQTPFNINSKFDRNKIDRCLDFKKKSFTKFKRDYISNLQNDRPNFEIINDKISEI